jgi:hypothetical protein
VDDVKNEEIRRTGKVRMGAGAVLFGFGALASLSRLRGRKRGLFSWILPGAFMWAGSAMLTGSLRGTKSKAIRRAEALVEDELGKLDPFSRAVVATDVIGRQMKRLPLPVRHRVA